MPGDVFTRRWLDNRELKPIRIAKELVKFNERCFIRLLGDMRSYNFVFVLTPDFEGWQVRIRAMDFDQQSYSGRRSFYLPQFFRENLALVQFCTSLLDLKTAHQYQRGGADAAPRSAPRPPSSASTCCSTRWPAT